MEDVIGVSEPYREPTQWCVDLFVNGVKYQLTFQQDEIPDTEQIELVVSNVLSVLEGRDRVA